MRHAFGAAPYTPPTPPSPWDRVVAWWRTRVEGRRERLAQQQRIDLLWDIARAVWRLQPPATALPGTGKRASR